MKNQLGSSRMDTVLKMLLIAFISLLAFSSGLYLGKQMSDNDYQLKALESDFSHSSQKVAEDSHHEAAGEEAIVDEEVAALSDKYINAQKDELDAAKKAASETAHHNEGDSKHESRKVASEEHAKADSHAAPAHGAHPTGAAAAHKAPAHREHDAASTDHSAPGTHGAPAAKPDLSAAHKAAVRVANNAAPTEAPKPAPESRIPTSLPKTVGATADVEFTVQVASYPTADAAKAHAQELVGKGFPAFPVEATVSGRTWYRVSVGSFKSMKEATSYRTQILKQADIQSAIVQRIQR